jgi:hypothetical protein
MPWSLRYLLTIQPERSRFRFGFHIFIRVSYITHFIKIQRLCSCR